MLSFTPQSLPALQARFPAALQQLFDVESIQLGIGVRPGQCRANIFDCDDGLRLIISREQSEQGTFLHISASLQEGHGLVEQLRQIAQERGAPAAAGAFKREAQARYRLISGDAEPLQFIGFRGQEMIPHWIRQE